MTAQDRPGTPGTPGTASGTGAGTDKPASVTIADTGQPQAGPRSTAAASTEEPQAELRADIERTREDLGDTVEALAAKTDIKARATDKAHELKQAATTTSRHKLHAVGGKVAPAARQARDKAGQFGAKARQATTSDDGAEQARRAGTVVIIGAAMVAAGVLVWRVRRARRAPATMPERLRAKAAELSAAVKDSDLSAQAAMRGQAAVAGLTCGIRNATSAPSINPRLQGAVAAATVLMVTARLRRRSRSREE
ncbi:DUF3618 domain-containing protein [Actinomadura rudentiformis]|uniref:DUF3618 domain-containing protein n=1 Tax=Actinomadura rudentiformis TaxID=359158 RepID=A0A6H9YYF0_9ACTN|nr:DUF3618 domain-containing protein [Actinomadura rudentiformis]KAB2346901.1 DUF3618 domain-containing protein [Actinomadura rudentiformis]